MTEPDHTLPPILLFVPALISASPGNSAARVAALLAEDLTNGPGTFHVESLANPGPGLSETWRITEKDRGPVLDVSLLDYRKGFALPAIGGFTLWSAAWRLMVSIGYAVRALTLWLRAQGKAKRGVARVHSLLGLAGVGVLVLSVVIAGLDLWWALSTPDSPDVLTLGLAGLAGWLYATGVRLIQRSADWLQSILEYADHETRSATVNHEFLPVLDGLVEGPAPRDVHVLGYSMGALVALDFLFPPASLHPTIDARHTAVKTLTTVGCPIDLARLYYPHYIDDRVERVPGLRWTNIFIAADILGSNLVDGDDFGTENPKPVAGLAPVNERYTDERLTWSNLISRKGILSHSQYWGEPGTANCLNLALAAITRR
ncbi:hypothetical protein [Cryptosporangium phraense]|uniref:Alpha/beta hydrolase n=1 Tax=Cryptosporangium phraense TaxID=2593070 RepID=A0A545AKY6_9ACTN|nr:hypothetical protein [Cryptosporangium phraense]TQS41986.1 hypothetical protein FL583_27290 [Cryptosporangium phraense]